MKHRSRLLRGFTIVELVIVISVMAVLATISIMAYTGIQERARDGKRVSDMGALQKALEVYKSQNGDQFPAIQYGGWNESSIAPINAFLKPLRDTGVLAEIPLDPINDATYRYKYYRYGAGNYGCDAARGHFYVLVVTKGENSQVSDSSPGFSCSGRNWQNEGWYVVGNYQF